MDVQAVFGGDAGGVQGGDADDILHLVGHPLRVGGGEIDFVDDRDDLQVVVHRQVGVGKGLGLDALAGVHHQHRPLAGGQGAAHLVPEVHVAGGVDEVELIPLAVIGVVVEAHRPGLDGDAPLLFQLHVIQNLGFHLPLGDGGGGLQKAVGQGALAVVDVGDDAEVADILLGEGHGSPPSWG